MTEEEMTLDLRRFIQAEVEAYLKDNLKRLLEDAKNERCYVINLAEEE